MTQSQFNDFVAQAMQMPYEQRWLLVDQLEESLHPPGEDITREEWWTAWRPEIQRRLREMESGEPGIPADQLFAELKARRNG